MLFYINLLGGLIFALLVPVLMKLNQYFSDKLAILSKEAAQNSAMQSNHV